MTVDALIRVSMGSAAIVNDEKKELVKDFHKLTRLDIRLEDLSKGGFIVRHNSVSYLVVDVKSKQNLDSLLMELK